MVPRTKCKTSKWLSRECQRPGSLLLTFRWGGWDTHSPATCISPHHFTSMFYLCLKILLGALNIDFFFFFLLAETLGLRKIDLVKVSPPVGGAEPKRSWQCREHSLTVTWQASAGVGTCITEKQLLCENGDNTYFVETKMCLLRPWHLLKYLIKFGYSSPSSSPT